MSRRLLYIYRKKIGRKQCIGELKKSELYKNSLTKTRIGKSGLETSLRLSYCIRYSVGENLGIGTIGSYSTLEL